MKSPALALFWHCWRLSRRWYLLMLAIALAIHFTAMNLAPPGMADLPNLHELLAPGTVIFGFVLAMFTTLLAISLGGKAGFPLRFEYRLPVSTAMLVGVPMATLAGLCASLYAIPMLLSKVLYGLPMPLLAGMAVIGSTAVLLAAGSWMVAGTSARAVLLLAAMTTGGWLFAWLKPIRPMNGARAPTPDLISLPASGYGVLLLVAIGLYALTVHGVRLQRRGERWQQPRLQEASGKGPAPATAGSLRDWASGLLRIPCPTTRPWLAELWYELKCHGMPVLALGVVLALLVPLLPLADSFTARPIAGMLATVAPLTLFFTGIGIAFFNRRVPSGGYMNAFEGTRALGTLPLAGVQFGALGLALIVALSLMALSLWLSATNFDSIGPLWSRAASILAPADGQNLLQLAANITALVTGLYALLAFFFCVHACSIFWGRKVMYIALALLIYAFVFARAVVTREAAGAFVFVVRNMWGIGGVVSALTLLLLARVAALRLLTRRAALVSLALWLVSAAGGYVAFVGPDTPPAGMPAELRAFTAAGLTLPYTLFLATLWCYDRLRHR